MTPKIRSSPLSDAARGAWRPAGVGASSMGASWAMRNPHDSRAATTSLRVAPARKIILILDPRTVLTLKGLRGSDCEGDFYITNGPKELLGEYFKPETGAYVGTAGLRSLRRCCGAASLGCSRLSGGSCHSAPLLHVQSPPLRPISSPVPTTIAHPITLYQRNEIPVK